ncbi:efflux RND transporter permease subunit [Streptomyces sp. NPDC003007]
MEGRALFRASAAAVLVGTFGMAPLLKTNFFDQGEQEVLTVRQELKPGTSLAATDAQAKKVEKLLARTEGVKDYQVTVGSSGFMAAFGGGTDTNQASYQVMLEGSASYEDVQSSIEKGLAGLKGIGTTTVAAGDGFGSQDLSVVVKAADADVLRTAAEEVRKTVASLDDVTDVSSDPATSVPRISVTAGDKAAAAGFNDQTLGAAVAQAVRGTTAAKATLDDTERDVVIRSAKPATTLKQLQDLRLGGTVKLGDIATVKLVDGPVSMTRIDGQRAATITAKPTGDNTGAVSTRLQSEIDALKLPDGATASIGGVSEDQDEAFANLGLAMLAAIAIVFMLLVGTFRSLIQPLILLVSIPFAATGAIGLLIATGTPMGVPAMIGMLMLMLIGIVVTNAIVLIDLINQYRRQGHGVVEAVIEGGRHRLRPILMTALATIFTLLPMALGITGEGGFIAQPLAVVVIGGLVTSTLLTLLLVPTLSRWSNSAGSAGRGSGRRRRACPPSGRTRRSRSPRTSDGLIRRRPGTGPAGRCPPARARVPYPVISNRSTGEGDPGVPLHSDDPKSVGGHRLLDRLGAGGMGVVYRARARSGREVAIKVVHAQYAADAVFRARFRQEIAAVRKVSGAFTAPVLDADPEAARPWMATQYVPGPSLARRIRDRGALPDAELRGLALGLVEALRDIHRAGVVHRDLKPANVLLAEDGPRVIDFGISRAAENHQTLTETGQMIGTPPFMSPEQLVDARAVGPASDVFSLGALLVYAVTGRGPFDADSPYLTAYRVVHDEPVLDGVGAPLRGLLGRCLSKEPADRPGLDELARELVAVLPEPADGDPATVPLRADRLPAVEPAHPATVADLPGALRPRRRVRPLLAATGTVGAVALALTAYLTLGPGWALSTERPATSPSANSRWAAPPAGWKPWQTTVYETAGRGVREVRQPQAGGSRGGPECRTYEGAVYCAGDGILPVRLDGRTGETVWRSGPVASVTGDDFSRFVILGVRDDTVLVRQELPGEGTTRVFAFDTGTGDRLWDRAVNDEWTEVALSGGIVVIPEGDGTSVTARSIRTGAARWTERLPAKHFCGITEAAGTLYLWCGPEAGGEDGLVMELHPADGPARRLRVPSEAGLLGAHDGRLLFLDPTQDQDGNTLVGEDAPYAAIRLVDPGTGAQSTTELAEEYEGEVTLTDGTLWFATSSGRVTAVSARTGRPLWQTPTSLEQPSEATYDPRTRTVYLASDSGRVGALDARKGTLLWETQPRAQSNATDWGATRVRLLEGALVAATPGGSVFSLDPAHPERKPRSG